MSASLPERSPKNGAERSSGGWALRWHLAALVIGVLVPVVGLFGFGVYELSRFQKEETTRRLAQAAHDVSDTLDRELAATIRALQALAQSQRLEVDDLEGFYNSASRTVQTEPSWFSVILFLPDGTSKINTAYGLRDALPPVMETESFRRVVAEQQPMIGSVAKGKGGMWAFPVRVPVMREGKLKYVLTAVIPAASVLTMMQGMAQSRDEWTRVIVDANGTMTARTRDHEKFVGTPPGDNYFKHVVGRESGTFHTVTLDGKDAYIAFSRARTSGWVASIVVPAEVLDGPARRTLWGVAGIGAGLMVLSAAGAVLLLRRVTRGIASAADAAATLATGGAPGPMRSSIAEIEQLGRSIRQSAALLSQRERERNDHLEHAEAARAEAETANRSKDEFLAMLGHELRNPLSPIRNGAHLLGSMQGLDPTVAEVRDTIERQVVHMTRMIDDLLDASRVMRGKLALRREDLDLAGLVRHAVGDFLPQFETAEIALALDAPEEAMFVHGDNTRLAQCMGNLLHNALKFTPARGSVRVSLVREGETAALTVEDTGVGISPVLIPALFQPFSQGPQSLSRSHGGLGLGLALVRGIVELHGGTVTAFSEGIGRGARFTVRLPLTAQRPGVLVPAQTGGKSSPRRVMVVEDLADAARTLKLVLSFDGHEVRTAATAGEALAMAAGFSPEAIVCDIGLPDMDGYELCERMREMPELKGVLMIALTGYGQEEDVDRALEAGFDLHLTKPVDIAALQAVLARGRRRAD